MATRTSSASRTGAGVASSGLGSLAIQRVAWLVALGAWAAFFASLVSFDPADPPGHAVAPLNGPGSLTNWMGPAGAAVAYHSLVMLGPGAWVIVIAAGIYLGLVAYRGTIGHPWVRALGVLMVAAAVSGFQAMLMPRLGSFPEGAGGLLAISGVSELGQRFGSLGTGLWLALMAVVGLTVALDDWFSAVPKVVGAPASAAGKWGGRFLSAAATMLPRRTRVRTNDVDDDQQLQTVAKRSRSTKPSVMAPVAELEPEVDEAEAPAAKRGKARKPRLEDEDEEATESAAPAPTPAPAKRSRAAAIEEDEDEAAQVLDEDDSEEPEAPDSAEVSASDDDSDEPVEFDPDELRKKIAKLPLRFGSDDSRAATAEDLESLRSHGGEDTHKEYVFPSLDLLIDPDPSYEAELEAYIREQAEALQNAMRTYGIKGEIAGIESGPVITLYQVRLAPGTKVNSITSVASDIARSLKAVNIRVVPNTEGLDTVGVEVPNRKKERVRLKELMTLNEATAKMKLPLFLGKDASGRAMVNDLAKLPHLLIAGTTGSGKSVCMNAIIMGFLYTQKPSDLKLVLVDPKVVELSQFKDIPHLMCPVVTDMSKAAAILEWAVGKMDERYELLAEAGCRDISSYNALGWEQLKERFSPQSEAEESRIPRKLPYMVFIIDELADLMMTNKEVEGSIVRIAQKARAVGIHLILATQRPQANVVTGLIKSNMPGRMCFKVASGMDSRIVLDQKGGELLLGQGDMLFITPQASIPVRAQGTLVDDEEIRKVVRSVREVSGPSFERQLVQLKGDPVEPGSEDHEQRMLENAQEDPLFDRAVEIVLETERGSVSLLQRRLAIGYTRASRLIELMGMAGIIGDHKGSVAREVQITLEEWEAMKRQAQLDSQGKADASAQPAQAKLFPEPVTAREITEVQRASGAAPAAPAAAPAAPAEPAKPAAISEPKVKAAPAMEESDAIEAEDELEGEDEEAQDLIEGEDEGEEAYDENEEDAEAEASDEDEEGEEDDEEYEYEYEYVDEDEELSEEYEVVEDEAPATPKAEAPAPEIVVKPANRERSNKPE